MDFPHNLSQPLILDSCPLPDISQALRGHAILWKVMATQLALEE